MMGIRVICVIAAVVVAQFSLWLALAFMVGGAVLPWCAVLIANDRPPQRSTAFVRYHPSAEESLTPAPAPAFGAGAATPRSPAGAPGGYVLDAVQIAPAGDPNGKGSSA